MRKVKIIEFFLVLLISILFISCENNEIITDINSEDELQNILENREEKTENDISDIFEDIVKEDMPKIEKESADTEEIIKSETTPNENVPHVPEKNHEIQQAQESQEVPEIQEVQKTQKNTEQEELKPYNDIYVVINGTQEYHRTSCEKLLQAESQNRNFYTSEKELYFNGILPCTECKPDY